MNLLLQRNFFYLYIFIYDNTQIKSKHNIMDKEEIAAIKSFKQGEKVTLIELFYIDADFDKDFIIKYYTKKMLDTTKQFEKYGKVLGDWTDFSTFDKQCVHFRAESVVIADIPFKIKNIKL